MEETYKFIKNNKKLMELLYTGGTCWECFNNFTELHVDLFLHYFDPIEGYRQHYGAAIYCPSCGNILIHRGNDIKNLGEEDNLTVNFTNSTYVGKVGSIMRRIDETRDVHPNTEHEYPKREGNYSSKSGKKKKRGGRKPKKEYKNAAIILA